jgi:hypothetical protein
LHLSGFFLLVIMLIILCNNYHFCNHKHYPFHFLLPFPTILMSLLNHSPIPHSLSCSNFNIYPVYIDIQSDKTPHYEKSAYECHSNVCVLAFNTHCFEIITHYSTIYRHYFEIITHYLIIYRHYFEINTHYSTIYRHYKTYNTHYPTIYRHYSTFNIHYKIVK